MGFMEAVTTCFSKIVSIEGRARRSEYWWFALCVYIIDIVLGLVLHEQGAIYTIISLVVGLASLTVSIRRLHDIGKSGWWILISLVPIVGVILLLIWHIKDSEPGDNQYGPNPKGVY